MGSIWLHDFFYRELPKHVPVDYMPGWELRSRSSGGFEKVLAIGTHHDAAPISATTKQRAAYAYHNAKYAPIGSASFTRAGHVLVGAAGATNTQGKSEHPIQVSKGVIPTSQGNLYMLSFEAENNGEGEIWGKPILECMEITLAFCCEYFGLNPLTDIISHHRYTLRKNDPRGPTPHRPSWGGITGLTEWSDINVGKSVQRRMKGKRVITDSRVVLDTRILGPKLTANKTYSLHRNILGVPVGYDVVWVTCTATDGDARGNISFPEVSKLNFQANESVANSFPLVLKNDTVEYKANQAVHVLFAVDGYE